MPVGIGYALTVFDKLGRNLRHRKHDVHTARHDRALRHPTEPSLVRVLCHNETTLFLDGPQTCAAVGTGSREEHGDGTRPAILRQRVEQEVERQPCTVPCLGVRQVKYTVADGKVGSGGNHVEVIGRDGHIFRGLPHGHRRVVGQQVHHHAFVRRVEVLHQDEGHAGVRGQCAKKLSAGAQATC